MRSLIILEVEHGEDTGPLQDAITAAVSIIDTSDIFATVNDYTVRVDLPECFELGE